MPNAEKKETLKEVLYNAVTYPDKLENMLETVFDEFNSSFKEFNLSLWKKCEFDIIDRYCTLKIEFEQSDDFQGLFNLNEIRYIKFYHENHRVFLEVVKDVNKTYYEENSDDQVTNVLEYYLMKKLSLNHVSQMGSDLYV